FTGVAHAMEPPPDLKDKVMSVLAEEWKEAPAPRISIRHLGVRTWLAVAAVAVLLAGALTWGGIAQTNASHFHTDALSYRQFLHALGGRDVRTATLSARTAQVIEGSAVLYDSDKGQSWILVMARAPGYSGQLEVSVSEPGGRTIALRPIDIGAEGEGSTWLVTAADISAFHTVRLSDQAGRLMAVGTVVER
ncbi:MAG TPA: hypothetical protein VKK30_06880, partial [Actinomycetota bacterium]|nr:hypothetical protein [Actinomycetota bacterium]